MSKAVLLAPIVLLASRAADTATVQEAAKGRHSTGLAAVELVSVDDEAVGYATFQSHNQKVVWNRRGIFTTHIRTRNEPYTAQTWRLSRSTDDRKSKVYFFKINTAGEQALETQER